MENTFFKDYQSMLVEIEALKKDADNPFFNSKYVQLKDVLAEVKKVCVKNNFIFYQTPQAKDGKNFLKTTVQHASGEKIEGEIEIVAKDASDPQKIGGGLTYMRRYSLTCMFGIEEEDDDGNINTGSIRNESKFEKSLGNQTCPKCGIEHQGQYPKCLDCWRKEKDTKKQVI